MDRIRQRFYWPGIKNDVESWISGCQVCQKRKLGKQKHRHEMQIWQPSSPFICVSLDILGPLPESRYNDKLYKYILLIGCNFTRWFVAVPLVDIRAETVCQAFLDSWVTVFGVPESLHSDNGTQFTSKIFSSMCERLQLPHSFSTPYHPQGNAKVERINKTLEDGLAKYCEEKHIDWAFHLQTFMMAYRSAVHETTGQTPFRLMFGTEMRMPVDFLHPTLPEQTITHRDYVFLRLSEASDLFEIVRRRCHVEQRRKKSLFDRKRYGPSYKVGDFVLLHSPVCAEGQSPKLKSFWSGPYRIHKMINQINFVLEKCDQSKKLQIAHYDRIKPFISASERIRDKSTKRGRKKRSNNKTAIEDSSDKLVYLDFSDAASDHPATHSGLPKSPVAIAPTAVPPASNAPTAASSAATSSAVTPLTSSDNSTATVTTYSRPRRATANYARYPGFYSNLIENDDDDADFKG